MKSIMLFLLVLATSPIVFGGYDHFDYTWHTYNGHQYAVTKDYYAGTDWWDAEAEAVAVGGHLVNINNSAENDWVSTTFAGYYDEGAPGNPWGSLVWIGLYRESTTSEWQWVCGDSVDYIAPWYDGAPLSYGLYAYLHPGSHPLSGTWWNNPLQTAVGIIEIPEPADDFEDGVIDGSKWVCGGERRGYDGSPSGSWQWSHQEIIDPSDGYLRAHVWGPYTGITYGAEAWIRTTQNFNDGGNYVINFTWQPDFADAHHNQYFLQITDGYIPTGNVPFYWQIGGVPGTTNLLWKQTQTGSWYNCWYFENQTTPGKLNWSLEILASGIARLYDAPDKAGVLLREESLDLSKDWFFRLMVFDGTSAGFGAGDAWFDIYDFEVTMLTVVSPNGGEALIAGKTETLAWKALENIENVSIEYSTSNGLSWQVIDANTPNDGEYDWTLPTVTSNQCLVRISDISNPNVSDTSDGVFTIYECVNPPASDLNRDCKVNIADLAIFASDWLFDGDPFSPEFTESLPIIWVPINDPGVSGHEGFTGEMSKYETTNAQYCQFLNAALASGDITVSGSTVYGATGSNSGADFVGQPYYNLAGPGNTYDGATNGGAARINYTDSTFTVDSGFENHPVTYVSWYGATAFCNYYGYRLPTECEWQAVADYDDSYTYGCGTDINNSIANYIGSTHPDGTTVVGSFGTYGYGMCDMAGNAYEWTNSVFDPQINDFRVPRGGSWYNDVTHCAVSFRHGFSPGLPYLAIGFRVCR